MVRWSFVIGCFVSWSIASGNGDALVARVYQLAAGAKSAAPAALSAAALAPPLDANISASVQDKVHLDVKIFASVKDDVHLLEDWLEYHSRLFGPHNLYVFDDASQDPKAQLILHTFAGQGVNVIWSKTESMQVPVYAGPKRRKLMDVTVKTLSSGSKGLAIIDYRKVSSYDLLGEHMRVLVPHAYIIPLDVDEFIAYVGPTDPHAPTKLTPTSDNGGIHPSYHNWRVQFDQKGIWDALRECKDRDGNNGYPGYHSTHTVKARICDRSLYEYADRALHLARVDLINPFLETDIVERLAANRRLLRDTKGKKFIRAGNWEHFEPGAHKFLTLNKAPFHFSRIVLAHYGDLEGMTKAGTRHKLEQRFVQTHWHIRLNLSMDDVKDLSGLDMEKCRRGFARAYCVWLVKFHQGKIVFRECTAIAKSSGFVLIGNGVNTDTSGGAKAPALPKLPR